jgi:hypothetical protein
LRERGKQGRMPCRQGLDGKPDAKMCFSPSIRMPS